MAFRCPVCESPEVDGTHLANHLAFTAVIRGDDHEDWLDEHVPGWGAMGPAGLAPKVTEAVPDVEIPEFEDDGEPGHDHGGGRLEAALAQQASHRGPGGEEAAGSDGRGDLTDEAAGVMAEARAMTKAMYGLGEEGDGLGEEADGLGEEMESGAAADSIESSDSSERESESETE